MTQFYFNDTIGTPSSVEVGSKAFGNTLRAFYSLQSDDRLKVAPRIVLDKDPETLFLGETHLYELVEGLTDRDEKYLAYSMLKDSYPYEDYIELEDEDVELADYGYKLNGVDATNLAVVARHGGYLFTIAYEKHQQKDTLTAYGTKDGNKVSVSIPNLYGSTDNTDYIRGQLTPKFDAAQMLVKFEMYAEIHEEFKTAFLKLPEQNQLEVHDCICEAFDKKYFNDDGKVTVTEYGLVRFEQYAGGPVFAICTKDTIALRIHVIPYNGGFCIINFFDKKACKQGANRKQNDFLVQTYKTFKAWKGIK